MATQTIPQEILDEIDETYLCRTLDEIPASPMIPQRYLDAIPHKHLDLAYGTDSDLQKLDLYLPEEPKEDVPLVMFIHGGGFIAGDKRDMQVCVYWGLLNSGYAVASINYRLAPAVKFPEPVRDCKQALRYLKANAAQYGIDPTRIGVAGNSAGGYYTLMTALTPNIPLFDGDLSASRYDTTVRCAIATYPVTDFRTVSRQGVEIGYPDTSSKNDTPEAQFLGASISQVDDTLFTQSSVIDYVTPQMPPLLLRAGLADQLVPYLQSEELAETLERTVDPSHFDFKLIEGAQHHDPAFKRPAWLAEATHFLDRYLK